jgi:transposase
MRRVLLVFVALVSVPRATWAQGEPLGPEFRVNTFTTNYQFRAAVASDGPGNFVVVWDSVFQDGSYNGVFGQRYDSAGAPIGPEFRVNTYTPGPQGLASVASDISGNFIVAWTSLQDGSSYGVFGQRYASTGAPLGGEFRVNAYTTAAQGFPSVGTDSTGNFVVVWESYQDGSIYGIFGQRYANTGAPLGPEFLVNTFTTGSQYNPAVAVSASGRFIVVWSSPQDGSADGVFGQRYANSGTPLGPEFRVNTYTTGGQYRPAVVSDPGGNFVVVWTSQLQDGSSNGVFGQRYDVSGAPLGPEFRVNTYTTDNQSAPSIAGDTSGNFVVVWDSVGQDGSSNGVFGQRYDVSGTRQGPEFRVNTYTTDLQFRAAVAAAGGGKFVVAWTSGTQDGSGYGVFGQRFGLIVPVELMHFGVE